MISNFNRIEDTDRATMLAISDVSNVNAYTIGSTLTESQPISMDHNRRLLNEIIDNTFDEKKGVCEVSSSQCASAKCQPSDYSWDKRLLYWKNMLKERQKISDQICVQTEKRRSGILYNNLVTVEDRDKCTIKSIMDYAHRLNATSLSVRTPLVLPEKYDTELAALLPELKETLPKSERLEAAQIEITGLPKHIKKELLGKAYPKGYNKHSHWLNSKHLRNRFEEKREEIECILKHFPEIENLEIVGESLFQTQFFEHNSDIQIESCSEICKVSTDTPPEDNAFPEQINDTNVEWPEYAFRVNDQEFSITNFRCYRSFKTLIDFSCFPFDTEVKKVLTLQNVGRKVLDFKWTQSSFYAKNSNLLKCLDNEFIFDTIPFRLISGEVQEIYIKFQPRRVGTVKSKWILRVSPTLFKRKIDGIELSLSGVCFVPTEYEEKLKQIEREVIEKSNKKMMETLTKILGTLAPDLIPIDCMCPYQRSLNEMELFEQVNCGFKCERYNDLELLKEIYERAKKPRDKSWDLQVLTLKRSILNVPQAETRALLFNELCDILHSMKGNSADLETKISSNTEGYRTRFLYVRGIIFTAIDEWLDLISVLEERFYQTSLQAVNADISMENEENGEYMENVDNLSQEESAKRQYIIEKRVRKLKPYRDAIYMQTYTLLCDFLENIVNVIESTE